MTDPIGAMGFTTYAAKTDSSGSTGNNTPASTSSADKPLLDPQAFLQLLVAQLQYQDPSNPVDTSSFMNQTAMLSQVQSMTSMSSTLSALAQAQQTQSATALIGKQVTYVDANGVRNDGVVSSASLLATGATLQVGDATVPLSSVIAVSAPPTS
jgi:flagellar basal-body rod modification protein FlgD